MIDESIALLKEWEPGEDRETFTTRVVEGNLLGKETRSRLRDLLSRIFFRRFPGPIADQLHRLINAGWSEADLRWLLLYHTAKADDLFYDFLTQHLARLYSEGRIWLDTEDGVQFIQHLIQEHLIAPPWSELITLKTSRGMLAAARDFGLLEGHNRKEFAHPYLSDGAFLYIAYSFAGTAIAPSDLTKHAEWRLFLLEPDQVERRFLQAHQNGDLRYYTTGGVTRIDWTWHDLNGLVTHLTEGSH